MARYTIVESTSHGVENVNRYEDLERHHPSSPELASRQYDTVNGRREEVKFRDREEIVKDFVLLQNGSDRNVSVPSPFPTSYAHPTGDATNSVFFYDKPFGTPGAQRLGAVLHMQPGSEPKEGQKIEYGKPIGIQSDYGAEPGAIHVHLQADLATQKKYISDVAEGRIQSGGVVTATPPAGTVSASPDSGTVKDKLLEKGEDGPGVKRLQEALNKAGIQVDGKPLPTTGHFGDMTEQAVKQYQQQKGLEVDGKAGKDTLTGLGIYPGQQQTPTQQTPTQQTPAPQPSNTSQPANTPAPETHANKTFLQQQSPETRAYLDLVAWKEVGQSLNADGSPAGYRERNGVAGSRGLMPESAIADNGKLPTSELRYNVGRYQMNGEDVKDMRDRYDKKIDDFSPESQDRIAVAKMKYRGVTESLEHGDIRGAITKGGKEWASLPGSPYGQVQSGYTADQAVEYYNKRLAFHQAQDRGQTTPTQGDTKPTQPQNTGAMSDGVLKQGEKGEDVRKLQEALNKNGAKLEADGNFGPATKAAVETYQRSHNLDADGIAGPKTLAALSTQQQAQTPAPTDKPQTPANAQTTPTPTDKPQTPANAQPTPTDKPQTPANAQTTPTDTPQTPPSSNTTVPPPTQTDKPLMSNPNHPDNKLYAQAVSNLEQLGPSGGFKSREDLEKAAAAVAADAKATGLKEIDHISKTNAPNGQTYLVAVQGDPTSPAAKNSYIDYNQATSQTVAQSTQMADAQKPAVQLAQQPAQQQDQPETSRPAVGAR